MMVCVTGPLQIWGGEVRLYTFYKSYCYEPKFRIICLLQEINLLMRCGFAMAMRYSFIIIFMIAYLLYQSFFF